MTLEQQPQDRSAPVKVNIDSIIRNEKLMTRVRREDHRVQFFKDLIEQGIDVGFIVINQDYELLDGDHRLAAYQDLGHKEVYVIIIETCGHHDAFQKATNLNSKHGLPYTNKDRQQQAIILFTTWPGPGKITDEDIIALARSMSCSRSQFRRYISGLIKPRKKMKDRLEEYDPELSANENAKALGVSESYAHRLKKKVNLFQMEQVQINEDAETILDESEEPAPKALDMATDPLSDTEEETVNPTPVAINTTPQSRQEAQAAIETVMEAATRSDTALHYSILEIQDQAVDAIESIIKEIEEHGVSDDGYNEALAIGERVNRALFEAVSDEELSWLIAYVLSTHGERRRKLIGTFADGVDRISEFHKTVTRDTVTRHMQATQGISGAQSSPSHYS